MATPTISEYTAHLREDKATMRNHLLSANIETKESDTFTDLSKKVLEKGNAIRRIYVQPDEPAAKHGLWFKRDAVEDFDVVSDPVPFVGDTLSAFNISYNPDSAYNKIKEAKTIHANNTVYYLAMDSLKDNYPDESFRIYEYDPYTNTYTKIQTYTADEVYNVRGDGGYYALSVFRNNGVACIDSEGEYLYLICGGYNTTAESQKYITRFGLKTHSAQRVHTKLSNWFPIPASDLSSAQIVDNKIYVFGQSTNAAAYGSAWNTRIIDLTTGSESTLNHGPIALGGRTIKVNSHLIAGFGGGASNMNSGQGMNQVHLFDTLTNTTTRIATLTNKNNSRALAVVGNLIYFVEYRSIGSSSKSVGYVNLIDNSVTYIDDVFTPKMQNIASSPAIYLSSARAIMLGSNIGQTYLYNLDTKPYDKDTVVLFQSTGVAAQYVVDLFTTNNFKTDVPFNISDAWFYKVGEGLETTGEVYYGNGTEWLPLVHGNTTGGVNALQLQHKIVEITEKGTTYITPDAGFEGLRYVDVIANVPNSGGSIEPVVEPDYITDGLIAWWEGEDNFDENNHWNSRIGTDYISPSTYITGYGNATDNPPVMTIDKAAYNNGIFSYVTNQDYCMQDYTIQVVGRFDGGRNTNTSVMNTLVGTNMSASPMIGIDDSGNTKFMNGSNVYHSKVYSNMTKKVFNASLNFVTPPVRGTNNAVELAASVNGESWFSVRNATEQHNSKGSNIAILCYYTDSYHSIGARLYSLRVYNRKLTEEELQHNFEIDKARFNIQDTGE